MKRAVGQPCASDNVDAKGALVNRIILRPQSHRSIVFTSLRAEKASRLEADEFHFRRGSLLALLRNSSMEHCAMIARVIITIALRARAFRTRSCDFVRSGVGAPTAHACAGNGSHHSEDFSPGRSRPPGEFSWAFVGTGTRCSRGSAALKEPLWIEARGPLSRPDWVRGEGNPFGGAHPSTRVTPVLSQSPAP